MVSFMRLSAHATIKPFDDDILIQITPETYHTLKNKIGDEGLGLLYQRLYADTANNLI